jgi:hypothetical protein
MKDQTPAFPLADSCADYCGTNREAANGMTLRDYIATHALQGMLSHNECDYTPMTAAAQKQAASDAYAMADAMLAAREA